MVTCKHEHRGNPEQIRTLSPEQRRGVIGRIQEEFGGLEAELTLVQAAELDWRLEEHAARPYDVIPCRVDETN